MWTSASVLLSLQIQKAGSLSASFYLICKITLDIAKLLRLLLGLERELS